MRTGHIAACALAVTLAIGCTEARLMDQQEAYAYCHTHPAGSTFAMNPFGEEYATWMSYCNQAWTQQMMPGMAFAADTWQRQQMINQMQQPTSATTCYQLGNTVRCQ